VLILTLIGEGAQEVEVGASVQVPPGGTRFVIGRDPGCDWALADRTLAVSARHCEILYSAEGAVLVDHSTNGTFVNGAAARMDDRHLLRDGDRFEVGPYTIEVRLTPEADDGLGFAATEALASGPTQEVTRPLSVEDTQPLSLALPRGGDPAAVAAPRARLAPEDTDLTRIRPALPRASSPPASPLPAPPSARDAARAPRSAVASGPPAAAAVPAPSLPTPVAAAPRPMPPVPPVAQVPPVATPAPAGDDALQARLAQALGLPTQALAGQDPERLLVQMGRLTRASVDALRRLLEAQAATQRAVGSRRAADWRTGASLRLADSTEDALLALLARNDAAPLAQAADALAVHEARLVEAARGALQRLGDDLAPAPLAAALSAPDPARQWALYGRLWQRLGLVAADADWAAGFAAAGWLHLAASYDEAPAPPRPDGPV
jgi:type VI secretion system FHA domain protein